MTSDELDNGRADATTGVFAPRTPDARAYGGVGHGQEWAVEDGEPAPWVELPVGASSCLYRLVRHPRTGRPARDPHGNYLYVPMRAAAARGVHAGTARVLPFPPRP